MTKTERTPPRGTSPTTSDVVTTTSASVTTAVTEMSVPVTSFTAELTAIINPETNAEKQSLMTGTKPKDSQTTFKDDLSSERSTPSRKSTPGMDFAERIQEEPTEALEYFYSQMRKMAHKTIRFNNAMDRLSDELKRNCPDAKTAESYWWTVEETYEIVLAHREDAIKGFSLTTKDADPFMEEKKQMLKDTQDKYLQTYTTLSLQRRGQGAMQAELEERTSTPSGLFDIPPLSYMGENLRREALPPPNLVPALLPPSTGKEDYRLLQRMKNPVGRPPPPPPKPQMMVHRPLLPQLGSVGQPGGGHSGTGIHLCQICREDQMTMENLEQHIDRVHGRQNIGPLQSLQQPQFQPQFYQQPHPYPQPPNQSQWYQGPQNPNMDMANMLNMVKVMTDSFAAIVSKNDDRNREEQKHQHEARLRDQRATALVNFPKEIEFYCQTFDPNLFKDEGKKLAEFKKFRKAMSSLETRMEALDIEEMSKYEILTKLVKHDAFDVIYMENPTDSTFKESLIKLEKHYLSKSLGIRDLYHQLQHLPTLHQTQSKLVNKTVTKALNLIEQLTATTVEANDVWFLVISEAMVPKMNPLSYQMWEKTVEKNIDETKPWGHKLTLEDLKVNLQRTKTIMHNRDINKNYNQEPPKDGQQKGQKQSNQTKKSEEEDKRKNTQGNSLYGQLTNSSDGADKSGMPVNKSNPNQCPVPNCVASNRSVKNTEGRWKDSDEAHRFLLNCPNIKGMSITERREFYRKSGCTCTCCFSTTHKFEACPLQLTYPKLCREKKKDGTVCGGDHHQMLHWEKKQNNRNQNTNASEQPPQ
jgi:hypothetical protein